MKFNNSKLIHLINTIALCAVSFSFPLGRKVTTPLLIFWVLSEIVLLVSSRKKVKILFLKKNLPYLVLIFYFLLHIIWLPFTSDIYSSLSDIEKKVSFLIFPILFALKKQNLYNADVVLNFFLYGCLIAVSISFSIAVYNSTSLIDGTLSFNPIIGEKANLRGYSFLKSVNYGGNYFFGSIISPFLHTTYYSMQLCFACVIIFFKTNWSGKNYKIIFPVVCVVIFSTVIFLLGSRAGVLTYMTLSVVFSIYTLITSRGKSRYAIVAVTILLTSLFINSPRFDFMIKKFNSLDFNIKENPTESLDLRLAVWGSSIELIKDNWIIGYGPGNERGELKEKYREKGFDYAAENTLNAHNQFLQELLSFGVIGFIFLISFIISPIFLKNKLAQLMLTALIIVFFVNSLFETVFGVFSGIIFFVFFYCLLINHSQALQNLKCTSHENIDAC